MSEAISILAGILQYGFFTVFGAIAIVFGILAACLVISSPFMAMAFIFRKIRGE